MKLFQNLNKELCEESCKTYAPYYFRYLGYAKDMAATPPILRANGISALFTETVPVILKNEIIAGNTKLIYADRDDFVLRAAKRVVDGFGSLDFFTNKDHYTPNYEHILSVGVNGIIDEINSSVKKHSHDACKVETLLSMRKTMEAFCNLLSRYADKALECKGKEGYNDVYLDFMAENCRALTKRPPETFAQALQLVWFCHHAFCLEERGAMALGRLDQYLYPFFARDMKNGVITHERAVGLLENVFIKLQGDTVNICIGGQKPDGSCDINELSYCILEAVKNCNIPGPNLSLRYTENIPSDFLDECLKTIGTGLGYPALMNDDINIAALKKYGYAQEDVYNYSMVGCIENFISGKQPPWSDGRFDPPRCFDYIFNDGVCRTDGSIGIDTGKLEDIKTMDDFMSAFEKQLEYAASCYMANFYNLNNKINRKYFPEPFLSCFCHDCIGRGLDINDGGAIYPSVHGVALMGIGTVADSLSAIEKVVFEDKAITLFELRDAMNANFEGYEALRKLLLRAPKYGNDDDFVDKYAVWYIDYLSGVFEKYKTPDGGGIYIAAAANVSNIYAGQTINATPDGRLRGEPLSDAASPTYGRDVSGSTAVIKSVSKPDYTKVACGSVVNQKYSPSSFDEKNIEKMRALVKAYFKLGGQEIQINATSRKTLEDAMKHPENHKNLVVRVSGFSAIYVDLQKEVQTDILNRTQHD